MLLHQTKLCAVTGLNLREPSELVVNVATEGAPDFILPAGFKFHWPTEKLTRTERKKK